jgi:hypothetical protein
MCIVADIDTEVSCVRPTKTELPNSQQCLRHTDLIQATAGVYITYGLDSAPNMQAWDSYEKRPLNVYRYANICTNKYCKFILNYSDMFWCQYTIFREFTVVLA